MQTFIVEAIFPPTQKIFTKIISTSSPKRNRNSQKLKLIFSEENNGNFLDINTKRDYDRKQNVNHEDQMSQANRFVAEKNLLDTLDRIARSHSAYSALYVSLSKLKPKNRHPSFIKIIAKLFDDLVGAAEGMMYILNSGDFVILGKNITENIVSNAVDKLRKGLASDPILFNANISEFAHLYNFPNDFYTLYEYIQEQLNNASLPDFSNLKYPIEASQMEGVLAHLDAINVPELIKHQSIIRLENANQFRVMFQEFFVAVKDLSAQYDKNMDITANKWLFLYLTQALDKKTIASFQAADIKNWPQCISLNMHLSSIFTPEFDTFLTDGPVNHPQIIAEVQMMDIFNKLESYFEAKEKLHKQGHQILIDGLIPETLSLIDINRLEPDLIKIFWNPMMEFDTNNQELHDIINRFGSNRIILAKCTDEKALRWGISYGIRNFQGPYMDTLETALIRSHCPDAQHCSATECLKRRRLITGVNRRQCRYPEILEKILGQTDGQ